MSLGNQSAIETIEPAPVHDDGDGGATLSYRGKVQNSKELLNVEKLKEIFFTVHHSKNDKLQRVKSDKIKGGSPGLVVMGGDS